MRQSHAIVIERPVEEVFAYAEDEANAPKWAEGIVRFEILNETKGQVGTTYRMVIKEGNTQNTYEGEVTAWVPNQHSQNVVHREGMAMTMDRDYRPVDKGTELTMSVAFDLRGAMKLMTPLVWLMNRRFLKKQATALKYLVEAQP